MLHWREGYDFGGCGKKVQTPQKSLFSEPTNPRRIKQNLPALFTAVNKQIPAGADMLVSDFACGAVTPVQMRAGDSVHLVYFSPISIKQPVTSELKQRTSAS